MSKTILITGATSGFGEAMAHVFAAAGNKLIITGRKESLLSGLQEILVAKHNASVHTLCFDVQNKEAVFAAINTIPDAFKNIEFIRFSDKTLAVQNIDVTPPTIAIFFTRASGAIHTRSTESSGHLVDPATIDSAGSQPTSRLGHPIKPFAKPTARPTRAAETA
jgi:NAD(P)-dependent dehydrogenase (short-subunit alcohol dehydrogenase family)